LEPWIAREPWLFDTTAPDHFREVSATRETKREALVCHASQNPTTLAGDADLQTEALRDRAGFAAEGFAGSGCIEAPVFRRRAGLRR
jgi:hypothetical protein